MNIDIDKDLLEEALALSDYKTKESVINEALVEFVRKRKQQKILELAGTIDFDPDYDYKAERFKR